MSQLERDLHDLHAKLITEAIHDECVEARKKELPLMEPDASHFGSITPPDPNPFKKVQVKDGQI